MKDNGNENEALLRVEHLCQHFDIGGGKANRAVDDVSFEIKKGEVFGLVGESGCGKTTTGRSVIRLYDITGGSVFFKGVRISEGELFYRNEIEGIRAEYAEKIAAAGKTDAAALKRERDGKIKEVRAKMAAAKREVRDADRAYYSRLVAECDGHYIPLINAAEKRGDASAVLSLREEHKRERARAEGARITSGIQMIFQDPTASLDPRMTVREIIAEGLVIQGMRDRAEIDKRVYEMLELVGLLREHAGRYPHEFSGGQQQRVGIARAIIMKPELIIADEPISALDVSIQAQVINLLNDLRQRLGLTVLFIAHDLSVVKYFSDRIGVMYFGKLIELANSRELFERPLHPYTRALLSAIPLPDPISERERRRITYNPLSEHDYSREKPTLREVVKGHFVYCSDTEYERYVRELGG